MDRGLDPDRACRRPDRVSFLQKHFLRHPFAGGEPLADLASARRRGGDRRPLSPDAYRSASDRLAQFHRSNDGMSVSVVSPEAIYNEFSSGTPDATAYRLFMKMLYDRAATEGKRAPQCLLIMGTASYDNRGIQPFLHRRIALHLHAGHLAIFR